MKKFIAVIVACLTCSGIYAQKELTKEPTWEITGLLASMPVLPLH